MNKRILASLMAAIMACSMGIAASAVSIFDGPFANGTIPTPAVGPNGYNLAYPLIQGELHEVEVTAGEGGTVTPAGVSEVIFGKDLTITVTADKGYAVDTVLVDGEAVALTDGAYVVEEVKTDVAVAVTFKRVIPTVAAEMNRAAAVVALWELAGSPVVASDAVYADVAADAAYIDALNWAVSVGVIKGYEDGTIQADKAISLEEALAMFHRYAVSEGIAGEETVLSLPTYACSVWAEVDVLWADLVGLLAGVNADVDLTTVATSADITAFLTAYVAIQ